MEIENLTKAELLELRGRIDARLAEIESQAMQEKTLLKILEGGRENDAPGEAKRGYVESKLINGYGPYLYKRWMENGRLRSKYLGKAKSLRAE